MRILQQNIDKLVGHIPKGVLTEVNDSCYFQIKFVRGIYIQRISKSGLHILFLFQEDVDALGGRLKTIYAKLESHNPLLEMERKYAV